MAKEQKEAGQASQGNEETRVPVTGMEKLQSMFSHGAIFNFGQPHDPPIRGKLQPVKLQQVQPTLERCTVTSYHDGGAWVGFQVKRDSGLQQCRTRSGEDAAKLKKLMSDPATYMRGDLGKLGINIDPVGGIISISA